MKVPSDHRTPSGCSYHRRRCRLSLGRLQNPHPYGGAAELPLVAVTQRDRSTSPPSRHPGSPLWPPLRFIGVDGTYEPFTLGRRLSMRDGLRPLHPLSGRMLR